MYPSNLKPMTWAILKYCNPFTNSQLPVVGSTTTVRTDRVEYRDLDPLEPLNSAWQYRKFLKWTREMGNNGMPRQ